MPQLLDKTPLSWRKAIENALYANQSIANSRFFQLASIDLHGAPNVRTVVFRGFDEQSDDLFFHTDKRSDKIAQLTQNPNVAVCWYFPLSREQFRLKAKAALLSEEQCEYHSLRQQHWFALSDKAKVAYFQPRPGIAIAELPYNSSIDTSQYDFSQVPENFILVKIAIRHVDYLNLSSTAHIRIIYHQQNDCWQSESIVP